MENDKKQTISVCFSKEIKHKAKQLAKDCGMSLSAFLTMLINNYKDGK